MGNHEILVQRAQHARTMYQYCRLCEHLCGVDRVAGQRGVCKAGADVRIWRYE